MGFCIRYKSLIPNISFVWSDPDFFLSLILIYRLKYLLKTNVPNRSNSFIVLAAVQQNGLLLRYADSILRADPKIVLSNKMD